MSISMRLGPSRDFYNSVNNSLRQRKLQELNNSFQSLVDPRVEPPVLQQINNDDANPQQFTLWVVVKNRVCQHMSL